MNLKEWVDLTLPSQFTIFHFLKMQRTLELLTASETHQAKVNLLRHRGRLHRQSPFLDTLLQTRIRQSVLARLSTIENNSNNHYIQTESNAHFEIACCYRDQELWSHAKTHAKKAYELLSSSASATHRARILVVLGVAISFVPERAASRIASSTVARKILKRAAKLVKLNIDVDESSRQMEDDDVHDEMNPYGEDDDFEADEADEDITTSSNLSNPNELHLARAEVCEAFGKICNKLAIEADASLRLRARKSAEEWLVSRDGAARLQERINDMTKKYLDNNATQAAKTKNGSNNNNSNNGNGWKKSTNAATVRHEAEGRSRSQLLKEATADVQEQLVEQGEATSEIYHKRAVDHFTTAWEYREAAFGSHHPETAMAYERLGRAHFKAGRNTLTAVKNQNQNQKGDKNQKNQMEHMHQAVSILEKAMRLISENDSVGPGSARHANIAILLSKACESIGNYKDASSLLRDAGAFYESEANRGVRCLVRPEETEDDSNLAIIIHQQSARNQSKTNAVLVLPPSVGALAAASESRTMYRDSMKLMLKSPMTTTDEEVQIGTDCIAVLKHSVRVSATHFGASSLEVAQDLTRLGALCFNYSWDMHLAKNSLKQAKCIFIQHGSSKDVEKVLNVLKKMRNDGNSNGGNGGDGDVENLDSNWLR